MSENDCKVLRKLASEYAVIAGHDRNDEKIRLHKNLNALQPIRPVLLIDEVPWSEMNFDGSLTLQCEDPLFQKHERQMRERLFQWKHFSADMALPPYLAVQKVIHSTGIGVEVQEETRATESDNQIVSHKYTDQFIEEGDIEKLHNPVITYDSRSTQNNFQKLGEAIGDLIPIKIVGESTGYGLGCKTWDIIATCMGVDTLLYHLIDRPEFMHKLVERLTDIFLNTVAQYEQLNLLDGDALSIHCAAASADELQTSLDREHVRTQNVWGRGLAQIFSSVSPDMHEEFDIAYMEKAMKPFGLVYYGCCEPLDRKISILEKIPNLRKISISPWANIQIAAEAIGKKYVLSAKPNPANLASATLDERQIRQEIQSILDACARHNSPCEILLKDISTVKHHPENLFRWEQIAMEMITGK